MPDPEPLCDALALLERVAAAIRDELGEEAEAYPGARSPDAADPLNRAFRALARRLLASEDSPDAPPSLVSGILRRLAERRLAAEEWDDRQVRSLIEEEPGAPDDWLAFLILSSRAQLEPSLAPADDPGPA